MAIKKNDFIEIDYVGKDKDAGDVFDTTDKAMAQKEGIHNPKMAYGPVIICIGQNHILKALDESLEGKELGQHTIELSPEQAFGHKSPKLIQLVSTAKFKAKGINPAPGLAVNIDGMTAIIKNVTGGRTLVDFNHPLSGKDVAYEITVNRIITNDSEKFKALMVNKLGLKDIETNIADGKATVTTVHDIPQEAQELLKSNIFELIPSIKDVAFIKKEAKKDDKKE